MDLNKLLTDWHEAGRAAFESNSGSLVYDEYAPKFAHEKRKYICLDVRSSGAFIVDKTDGNVYRLKSAYGVPNKKKLCGNIETITGVDLNRLRWW